MTSAILKKNMIAAIAVACVVGVFGFSSLVSAGPEGPKDATTGTKAANDKLYKELPFADKQAFKDAHKGFIAPLPQAMIKGKAGNLIWNPTQYDFIKEGEKAPGSVNPSLWRQSQLINISGLFEVTDGIYQVTNQDLSNMTIIEGDKGIAVFDPMVSAETANVGMELYYKNRGKKDVIAVVYSHSISACLSATRPHCMS